MHMGDVAKIHMQAAGLIPKRFAFWNKCDILDIVLLPFTCLLYCYICCDHLVKLLLFVVLSLDGSMLSSMPSPRTIYLYCVMYHIYLYK
ncbi:hypothetical protein XELAEV_18017907mg [Xenopus laevis]|uniref:Uncharacterized protein n=1 Tax=Xenopus laevis TaxID=8355 RepID=A0A974DCJ6_XENLA|nr:hypothetical protein XELAEV_18017907mg [Xenopus laevis]